MRHRDARLYARTTLWSKSGGWTTFGRLWQKWTFLPQCSGKRAKTIVTGHWHLKVNQDDYRGGEDAGRETRRQLSKESEKSLAEKSLLDLRARCVDAR
jgi:hypothetical protein